MTLLYHKQKMCCITQSEELKEWYNYYVYLFSINFYSLINWKNEWGVIHERTFFHLLSFYSGFLVGHLLIVYLSRLFRHKFIVIIRSRKSFFFLFPSACFPCCSRADKLGEGLMGRRQNDLGEEIVSRIENIKREL